MSVRSPTGTSAAPKPERTQTLRRFLPLLAIAAGIAAVFVLDLDRFLSFTALAENRQRLAAFVAANSGLAALVYVTVYAAAVALSIPGALILTLTGGFLFGLVAGTVLTVMGASIGAIVIFLVARTALGDTLRAKVGPFVRKLEAGFRENALSYLLVLRLVPLFPFWLVNLVPAFLGVPLSTYALATVLGIIPGTFVYVSVGNGLGAVFDAGGTPDLSLIGRPEILLPILGLAVLSLVPVAYKRLKGNGHG